MHEYICVCGVCVHMGMTMYVCLCMCVNEWCRLVYVFLCVYMYVDPSGNSRCLRLSFSSMVCDMGL